MNTLLDEPSRSRSPTPPTRRAVLRSTAAPSCNSSAAACWSASPATAPGRRRPAAPASARQPVPNDISAWLHIAADNRITVFTGKVEVGQNIRTSLAQLVAEELSVPFDAITMVMGDTDLVPYDMGTFGSQSTPQMGPRLRTMAAAARQALLEMAAKQWNCRRRLPHRRRRQSHRAQRQPVAHLRPAHPWRKARRRRLQRTPRPSLRQPHWKIAGTPVPKANGREFVTGKHQYPSDISLPGMMFGKVLRPTGFNATLDSVDTSAAEKMPGVKLVRDGDFIGLVAPDAYTAEQAIAAIKAKWTVPPQPSNTGIFDYLKNNARIRRRRRPRPARRRSPARKPGRSRRSNSPSPTPSSTSRTLRWSPAPPSPNGTRPASSPCGPEPSVPSACATSWSPPSISTPAQVRVIQPDMGSGYGGKHTGEAAVEAARLAKAAGAPVKLVWTREEEFTWAYFRPAGLMELKASVAPDGTLGAWEHHNYNSGNAGLPTPYNVANPVTAIPRVEIAFAPRFLPRARFHRQPLRP